VLDTLLAKLAGPSDGISPKPHAPLERSALLWLLLVLPVLGVLVVWLADPIRAFLARSRRRRRGDGFKKALARLAAAEDLAPAETLDCVRDALTLYVTANAGVPAGAVSATGLPAQLERRGVATDLAARLGDLLRELVEARYSPDKAAMASQASELRSECEACLRALEEGRRKKRWRASTAASLMLAMSIAAAGALVPSAAHADNQAGALPAETLEKAVEAQADDQWEQAAKLWRELDEVRPNSAQILYNLGTALAHTGDYGEARLALERASLHAPGDHQIEQNRDLVQQIVQLRQIEQARGMVRNNTTSEGLFWWRLATSVSAHWLLVMLTVLAWLIFLASLVKKFARDEAARETALVIGVMCALVMALTVGVWVARGQILANVRPAVVLAPDSLLREGPSEHAGLADIDAILVPGVLMPVEDTRDSWVKLGFADGTAAWTPRENVALVE
jgi:tetratricopeptide (TPR) repeat protein